MSQIEIDKEAADQLREVIGEDQFLRIGVRGGGCSGFEYVLALDDTVGEDDTVLNYDDQVKVVINAESAPLLEGIRVRWQKEALQSGFMIENPGASSCGCGVSFRPKDAESCF